LAWVKGQPAVSRAPGVILISLFYKNSLPILVYSELLNFVREPGFKGVGKRGRGVMGG